MPLPTTDLINWLASLGWDGTQESGAPLIMGPYVPDSPDKMVVVSPTPGPGFQFEAAADASGFQARVRGGQNDQPGAESLAYALDSLILGAQFPVLGASGKTIIHIHRLGGTPWPLSPNPDDAERFSYVTQYVVIAST